MPSNTKKKGVANKKSKSVKRSNKISWKNKRGRENATRIGKHFHFCESKLSREDIIRLSNGSYFDKLKNGGYIKQAKKAPNGIFTVTENYKKEFKENVNHSYKCLNKSTQ